MIPPGQQNVDEDLDNNHTDADLETDDPTNCSPLGPSGSDFGTGNAQQPESSSVSKDETDGHYSSLRSDEGSNWRGNQEQNPDHNQCELAVPSCQTLKYVE